MFGFFKRKVMGLSSENGVEMKSDLKADICIPDINDVPMICTFDLDPEVEKVLRANRFNCISGTLGGLMDVPNLKRNTQHLLRAVHSVPDNFHEFDVAVVDLGYRGNTVYDQDQHLDLKRVGSSITYAFLSQYPQHVFDFKPFGVGVLKDGVGDFLAGGSILIIFSERESRASYDLVEISSAGNQVCNKLEYSNLDVYHGFPEVVSRKGSRVKLPVASGGVSELVLKYMQGGEYSVIFKHPSTWDRSSGKSVPVESFRPLALNEADEVVSYVQDVAEGVVLVFPQVVNKGQFLCELFNGHLAEFFPKIFPYNGQFGWLDDGSYPLPGEAELLEEKIEIESVYENDMAKNKLALEKIKEDNRFLRDILTETGPKLVSAIAIYLRWLGFESVVNMDDSDNDTLEEDLQVDCGDKLLVVEIKGIGGTSTDKACSQITKIKFRRAEQRGRFDVFGLYIVNHQRYVSPKDRKNPPFTDNQIKDAVLDKRGLLTTYDLYRAYFLVLGGVLSKEFVREQLFGFGVVDFYPSDMVSFGHPEEIFKKGKIVILTLDGQSLSVGMKLVAKKGDSYTVHIIESLQVDGVDVLEVGNGEVGVMLDIGVPNRSEILLWSR